MYLGKSLYIQRFFANGNCKESTFISTSETTLKIHKCSLTEVLAHVQLQTAKLSHRYILGCGLFIFFVPLLIHFPAIPNLIIFWDLKISMTVGYYVDISNPAIIFWWGYNLKVLTFTKKKKKNCDFIKNGRTLENLASNFTVYSRWPKGDINMQRFFICFKKVP